MKIKIFIGFQSLEADFSKLQQEVNKWLSKNSDSITIKSVTPTLSGENPVLVITVLYEDCETVEP